MIAYLKGRVLAVTSESIIIENHGMGFEVYCSGEAFQLAQRNRGEVELYTYMQVKEDDMTLYGFTSLSEKQVFLDLISVSGVGCKLAIGILMGMRAEEIARCIATADVKGLSRIKGLGKKTAEKIVLELHGKVSAEELLSASGENLSGGVTTQKAIPVSAVDEEAVSALMGLGFTRNESVNAVKRAKENGATTVEAVIRLALSGM